MFGNISDVAHGLQCPLGPRDELYARLHEIDDAAHDPKHEKLHFNDRQFTQPFEDFLALLNAGVRAVNPQEQG